MLEIPSVRVCPGYTSGRPMSVAEFRCGVSPSRFTLGASCSIASTKSNSSRPFRSDLPDGDVRLGDLRLADLRIGGIWLDLGLRELDLRLGGLGVSDCRPTDPRFSGLRFDLLLGDHRFGDRLAREWTRRSSVRHSSDRRPSARRISSGCGRPTLDTSGPPLTLALPFGIRLRSRLVGSKPRRHHHSLHFVGRLDHGNQRTNA